MIATCAVSLVLALLVILNWDKENQVAYILLIIFIALTFIGSLLLMIFDKELVKKSNSQFANGVTYTYQFFDKYFTIESLINNERKTIKYNYNSLYKVTVKNDTLCIYPTKLAIYFMKFDINDYEKIKTIFKDYIK
jgi:amino acid transporter